MQINRVIAQLQRTLYHTFLIVNSIPFLCYLIYSRLNALISVYLQVSVLVRMSRLPFYLSIPK